MSFSNFYNNILVIDIETVSAVSDFSELPQRFREHWEYKASHIKNDEEYSAEELYFKKAAIYAEFGKIICISAGFFHHLEGSDYQLRITSFASHDEKLLLSEFRELLLKFNPKELKLVAHNGREFDFPYICRRMLVNEITLPDCLQLNDKKPWDIKHIDTMDMWKFGDRKSYTSLDLLATLFGISSSKQGIDGSMVNETYYNKNDLPKISEYCMADVAVTARLYLRMNLLPAIKEENIVYIGTETA